MPKEIKLEDFMFTGVFEGMECEGNKISNLQYNIPLRTKLITIVPITSCPLLIIIGFITWILI